MKKTIVCALALSMSCAFISCKKGMDRIGQVITKANENESSSIIDFNNNFLDSYKRTTSHVESIVKYAEAAVKKAKGEDVSYLPSVMGAMDFTLEQIKAVPEGFDNEKESIEKEFKVYKDKKANIEKIFEELQSYIKAEDYKDDIDVQRSSISHITSGRNKPSLEFIIKIKSRFPEILWDWLVTGEGIMLKSELPEITEPDIKDDNLIETENIKPTSLPDLFTMINEDENFGVDEGKISPSKMSSGESFIPNESTTKNDLADSQRLAESFVQSANQSTDNQKDNIKRIVIFYENGKFESFEP